VCVFVVQLWSQMNSHSDGKGERVYVCEREREREEGERVSVYMCAREYTRYLEGQEGHTASCLCLCSVLSLSV